MSIKLILCCGFLSLFLNFGCKIEERAIKSIEPLSILEKSNSELKSLCKQKKIKPVIYEHLFRLRDSLFFQPPTNIELDTVILAHYSYWQSYHGYVPGGKVINRLIVGSLEKTIKSNFYESSIQRISNNKYSFCEENIFIEYLKKGKLEYLDDYANEKSKQISHPGTIYVSIIDFPNKKILFTSVLEQFCLD